MKPVLAIENLSRSFKDVKALKNVSLEINKGEIFGLLGPDGAGKSTLIYITVGLLKADQGKVTLFDNNMLKDPEKIKPELGILPQGLGLSLAAELSVEENVDYFAEINGVSAKKREELKNDLLTVTKLANFKDRAAKNLSGGMKQKLGLCCTLIHSPRMIFLDEPTTGVDPISRRDIWFLINKIIKEYDITILLTTSYMDEAERCHRMALMHQGEILAMGDMDYLSRQIDGRLLEIYVDDQQKAVNVFKKMKQVKVIYPMGHRLNAIFTTTDGNGETEKLIREAAGGGGVKLERVEPGIPALEDVFLTKVMKDSGGVNQQALEDFFKVPGEGKKETKKEQKSEQKKELKKDKKSKPSGAGAGDLMIEVKNLYKYFGKFTAVDNVTFDVKRGEIFGFLGPNGAGKTTTIKMLCGLFPPSSGSGKISSFDLMKEQFNIKKSIGYMSQKFSLYRDLTVGENIELYAGIYGVNPGELKRRKDLILQIADLEGKDRVITDSLPMGIKQRLALGCSIIHQPEVIFLDEPTSGVDPVARRLFWDTIFFLSRKMKVTILVTTHYMDEAEHCDRVSLMNQGKLIALGSPEELKQDVTRQMGSMLEVLTDSPFETLEALQKECGFCTIFGRKIHLYTKDPKNEEQRIEEILGRKKIKLLDLAEKVIPFEDVFVFFCERAGGAPLG